MKTTTNILKLILIASVCLTIGACDEKSRRARTLPAAQNGGGNGSGSGNSGDTLAGQLNMGTSFSGGGTGVQGRVFESYRVNPFELEAFRELQPIFQSIIGSAAAEADMPDDMDFGFVPFVSRKAWYIAPVELDGVARDSLGLEFLGGETDQLARQSLREVWINQEKFETMSLEDQAVLILHEMVMSEYMLKFKTLPEYCQDSFDVNIYSEESVADVEQSDSEEGDEEESFHICESETLNQLSQYLPRPENPRELNEQDNLNIRTVVGRLLDLRSEDATMSFTALLNLMKQNDFDERWIDMFLRGLSGDEGGLSVPSTNIRLAFEKAGTPNNRLRYCYDQESSEYVECDTSVSLQSVNTSPLSDEVEGSSFDMNSIVFEAGNSNIRSQFISAYESDESGENNYLGGFGGMNLYIHVSMPVFSEQDVEQNNRVYQTISIFSAGTRYTEEDPIILTLEHMILMPAYIYQVDRNGENDPEYQTLFHTCHFSLNFDSPNPEDQVQIFSRTNEPFEQILFALTANNSTWSQFDCLLLP